MNDQLSKIDHLAIIVENIEESVKYYSTKFNDNINLALVTEDEHPNHFAIVDRSIVKEKNIQYHRDGIGYIYETDPNGNFIELLDQES